MKLYMLYGLLESRQPLFDITIFVTIHSHGAAGQASQHKYVSNLGYCRGYWCKWGLLLLIPKICRVHSYNLVEHS